MGKNGPGFIRLKMVGLFLKKFVVNFLGLVICEGFRQDLIVNFFISFLNKNFFLLFSNLVLDFIDLVLF